MKTRIPSQALRALAVATLTAELALPSSAIIYSWTGGGSSANWSAGDNWGGTAPAFSAADTADLSTLNLAAGATSNIDAPTTLGILRIGDTDKTHAYALTGSTLTMNNGGAGASIVQTATSTDNTINAPIALTENLSIENASTSQFNLYGGFSGSGAITFSGTNGGQFRVQGGVGTDVTALYQNSNGSLTFATTFSLDADGITLGIGPSGTSTLRTEQAFNGTGDITLVNNAVSGGSLYIGGVNHNGSVFHSGTSTVDDQINGNVGSNVVSIVQQSATSMLDIRGGKLTIHSGGFTTLINTGGKSINLKQSTAGRGTLVLRNNTATGDGVSTREGTLAHTGNVVSDGTGSGSTMIWSNIGTTITNITQNSSTSQLNFNDSTFNVNPNGITVVNNGGARIDFKDDVAGTGDLFLMNNSSVNDAVYYKEKSMNHAGRVVNCGTGTGRSQLTGNSRIGTNVTAIVQDSATSAFLVGGSLSTSPFAGDVTVKRGTLQLTQSGYLTPEATVTIDSGAVLNLNFTGTRAVGALTLAGQPKNKGLYSSANSGGLITGNGVLQVVASPFPPTVITLK